MDFWKLHTEKLVGKKGKKTVTKVTDEIVYMMQQMNKEHYITHAVLVFLMTINS